jgi:hypothetical protein
MEPCPKNSFLSSHVKILCESYFRLTGEHLADPGLSDTEKAEFLYKAPFALLSHDNQQDPIFTYGNKTAQKLFEFSWEELIRTPSRKSAEAPAREQRQRLLDEVSKNGFIKNYSGVRISKSARRFYITQATVWNLINFERQIKIGQAAIFDCWNFL